LAAAALAAAAVAIEAVVLLHGVLLNAAAVDATVTLLLLQCLDSAVALAVALSFAAMLLLAFLPPFTLLH